MNKNKIRTRIISAFPGTGKTHYYNNQKQYKVLDSDSSNFSWVHTNGIKTKTRNHEFPQNYINHIKMQIGHYDFIFVSTHREVREALLNNCLFFYLVYPDRHEKKKYLKRYKDRGNEDSFVKLLSDNWDIWMKEIWFCDIGCKKIKMVLPFLDEEIQHIVASENGEK